MSDIPIYWTEIAISKFEVSVKSVNKENKRYHIHINENVIRPAGGGQAGDRGTITADDKTVTILDTIGSVDDVILVTEMPVSEGVRCQLEIDMAWRFAMMKNHTAEHLFASVITSNENVKVGELWIDGKHGSIELIGAALDIDSILEVELCKRIDS